jgi:hypothetical protein
MAKVKIKVTRETKGGARNPFVVIVDDETEKARVVEFQNGDEAETYVEAERTHMLVVHCEGPKGARNTATLLQGGQKIIPPLTAGVRSDHGVGYASAPFKAAP